MRRARGRVVTSTNSTPLVTAWAFGSASRAEIATTDQDTFPACNPQPATLRARARQRNSDLASTNERVVSRGYCFLFPVHVPSPSSPNEAVPFILFPSIFPV